MRRLTFTYFYPGIFGCLCFSARTAASFSSVLPTGHSVLLMYITYLTHLPLMGICVFSGSSCKPRCHYLYTPHFPQVGAEPQEALGRGVCTHSHTCAPCETTFLEFAASSILANNREDDLFSCALMSVCLTVHPSLHASTVSIIYSTPPPPPSTYPPSVRPSIHPRHHLSSLPLNLVKDCFSIDSKILLLLLKRSLSIFSCLRNGEFPFELNTYI